MTSSIVSSTTSRWAGLLFSALAVPPREASILFFWSVLGLLFLLELELLLGRRLPLISLWPLLTLVALFLDLRRLPTVLLVYLALSEDTLLDLR